MSPLAAKPIWTEWPLGERPCQFSHADAAENASTLLDALGSEWLLGEDQVHPIIAAWQKQDLSSYLTLNGLAVDLRALRDVEGLASVIHDLRQAKSYAATLLTLRSAAMFARGGNKVINFFEPTNESVPDYLIRVDGIFIPVEAKQLSKSEAQKAFDKLAVEFQANVETQIFSDECYYPAITTIVKDASNLPSVAVLIKAILDLLRIAEGRPLGVRTGTFNVFLDFDAPRSYVSFRQSIIACPRSPKENTRLQRNVEKANKQLKRWSDNPHPGLLVLGTTEYQNPHDVADFLKSKFNGAQYRSISSAILLRSGTYSDETINALLDVWNDVPNVNAHVPAPGFIGFAASGAWGNIFEAPRTDELPAYRNGFVQAAFTNDGESDFNLVMPDLRALTPEMFV